MCLLCTGPEHHNGNSRERSWRQLCPENALASLHVLSLCLALAFADVLHLICWVCTQTVLEIYSSLTNCDEFVGLSRSERYFATLCAPLTPPVRHPSAPDDLLL